MEKTLSLSEAKMKLNRLVDRVSANGDEFIITKNGSPVAAMVPASVYEGWRETGEIRSDPEFMKEIKKGIERLRKGGRRYAFDDIFGKSKPA